MFKRYKKSLNDVDKVQYFTYLLLFVIVNVALLSISYWFLLLYVFLFLFFKFKYQSSNDFLRSIMQDNLFVFGAKGCGKDLTIQHGINLNKNVKYVSNIDYGSNVKQTTNLARVFDIGNTFKDLVTDNIKVIPKLEYEGFHMVISDASIYFPSQEDTQLKKEFPSFPFFYALSRHLYDMPIIVNTQVNGRLWKSMREQVQDGYLKALETRGTDKRKAYYRNIPILRNYLFVDLRYYDKEQSAELGLLPFKKVAVANKVMDKTVYMTSAGATEEMYKSSYGTIKDFTICIPKKSIHYDTRFFHKLIFGTPYVKGVKNV